MDEQGEREDLAARLKALGEENAALREALGARDKAHGEALEKLKAEHAAQLAAARKGAAIELALTRAGARSAKAARALLREEELALGPDGRVEGLDAQLEALRESDPYLFEETKAPRLKSFTPGESADELPPAKPDPARMTYSQMAAYLAERFNP